MSFGGSRTGFARSSSGGSGSQPGDYFENVTGRSQYERQSWRDSYNDGRAAGDVTGNINARLDAERSAFQGSTWTGSSTQPSALERAQAMARTSGPASGLTVTQPGGVQTAGPGSPAAKKGGGTLTLGPGAPVALTRAEPLKQGRKDSATGGVVFGLEWLAWPGSSNVEDFWETRYGEPGEFVGGIVNMPLDIGYNVGKGARRLADHIGSMGDQGLIQQVGRGPGSLGAISDWYHSFDYTATPTRDGYTGYLTGGGF